MKKLKKLSDKEHYELFQKVDNEGFDYYMLYYGPELDLIERLGFDKKEVKNAINIFKKIHSEILKGEQKWSEEFN